MVNSATIQEINDLRKAIASFQENELDIEYSKALQSTKNIVIENEVAIVFTNLGENDELDVQVSFHFKELELKKEITGDNIFKVETFQFEDVTHAIEAFKDWDFEEFIYFK